MNTFSGVECIRFGWQTFKKRPWFFIGVAILLGIAGGFANGFRSIFAVQSLTSLFGSAVYWILTMLIGMGTTALFLKAHDSIETARDLDLWHPRPFWKYTGATILFALVVVVGFILLIVPGVIAALMFIFTAYLVINRNLGPIKAMKESARITKGHRSQLLILFALVLVLNIVGAILLLVGLLVTIPVTSLATVHACRTLAKMAPAA